MSYWHVNLPRELREPVREMARKQQMGIQEMMVQLLQFALVRPDAVSYYQTLGQGETGERSEA